VQQPRLVASDVDGTLLGLDDVPSARTRAAVANVLARGTPFVLVTGRPPRWIPRVAEHLPGVAMAVCANGAVRYDIAADRVIEAVTLAPEALRALAEACARALPGAWLGVERPGRSAFDGGAPFVCEYGYQHAWPDSDHVSAPREALFDEPAVKLLARHPGMTSDAMVAALAPLVGDAVALTFSNPYGLVEAAPAGVTKATGLASVAAEAGVEPADAIAFGDMPNDIPMLYWAGHGVAMANAHPDVLAAADEVTATNTDDGVALVLERWFSA
jgi:hydroxymethylpyrimidine pyrophosphatase-like HAD family hydrolase